MANTDRQQTIDLKQQLLRHGRKIPFIQIIRLLRHILAGKEGLSRNDERVFDLIRIRPALSLDFPGTDIVAVEELNRHDGNIFRITATFMGLYGSSSPLPTFYTEDLIDERRDEGSITRDFIDIFNEPFYSHFFKIWEKYSIAHRLAENPEDQAYEYLFSLLGLAGENVRTSLPHNKNFLSYIGIATQAPRSASGLRSIVTDLLQCEEVEIEQCVEYKAEIDVNQRLSLGHKNSILGEDAHIGSQATDIMGKFRFHIGPIDITLLQSVLPDTPAYELIIEAVKFYLDQPLLWDIQLKVLPDKIKTTEPGNGNRCKLGWNTWLFSGKKPTATGTVPLLGAVH